MKTLFFAVEAVETLKVLYDKAKEELRGEDGETYELLRMVFIAFEIKYLGEFQSVHFDDCQD